MIEHIHTKVLGMGEADFISSPMETLKCYSLGSCVAVCMFVPSLHIAAMAHIVLPSQRLYGNTSPSKHGLYYYADSGVQEMIRQLNLKGVKFNNDIIVKLAGGAEILEVIENKIGKKNVLAVKKALWKYRLGPVSEDVGGVLSRTVSINLDEGSVIITSPGRDALKI